MILLGPILGIILGAGTGWLIWRMSPDYLRGE